MNAGWRITRLTAERTFVAPPKPWSRTAKSYFGRDQFRNILCGTKVNNIFLFISLFFNFYFYSCTTSVGYGDAKSFQAVSSPQTYGEAYTMRKKDCIGHVQKWMGSRLRRWQGENRKIVLEDGKSVVISKRLTDSLIDE